MKEVTQPLARPDVAPLIGYVNFSEGKPDARFQRQLNDVYAALASAGESAPWRALQGLLQDKLAEVKAGSGNAFRNATQAESAIRLVFENLLPAYRLHHTDLLSQLEESDLWQPFFLARCFEAVLSQGAPWHEVQRLVRGALTQLNDFVGHRPIAILETRPRGEPYDHEKLRPIPLFIRGAGVSWGRYHDLTVQAIAILEKTDRGLLADAGFDLDLLDELAVDPRAFDHGHPANRRPNYVFGEWDPHCLDIQGRYRRFVVRTVLLQALFDRVENTPGRDPSELLDEAAAVLAGTILMAAGVSGGHPQAHDSTTTLATLMPRIARCRDAFYKQLLGQHGGAHGARLHQEAGVLRQPFGGARQHVNQVLARHRALQLQERQLALLTAEMGFPDASREYAARIPAVSVRFVSEIHICLAWGRRALARGQLAQTAGLLADIDDLLQRGIACGALPDPWNILGFQGLFPLAAAQEDCVRDSRIGVLVDIIAQVFALYEGVLTEGAATVARTQWDTIAHAMQKFATWWDRFASTEVSDVRHVHGAQIVNSTIQVAEALALWRQGSEPGAELAFWRRHQDKLRSPRAFARVIDALLGKRDFAAAMALLMTWLGQVEQEPLEEGDDSFHILALRWLLELFASSLEKAEKAKLATKFFDYLEANAEDYWEVPTLEAGDTTDAPEEADIYSAAYDDVTYEDSTDDDQEGAVYEGGPIGAPFALEADGERIHCRLRFHTTVARMWMIAARAHGMSDEPSVSWPEQLRAWLGAAQTHYQQLLELLDSVHATPIPEPVGSFDSLVEFDQRRVAKEQLQYHVIEACHDHYLAMGALKAVLSQSEKEHLSDTRWAPDAARLDRLIEQGDAGGVRIVYPQFLDHFRDEPLLFTALSDGGNPRQILRVRLAQTMLRTLAVSLPRLGMIRETHHLLQTARSMEKANRPAGRGVTQFNELFQISFMAVLEGVVESATHWDEAVPWGNVDAGKFIATLLEQLAEPFLQLWIDHSQTLQLATVEAIRLEADWNELCSFIQRYGRELFHAKFMTLGNLRGILHRGVAAYLEHMRDNPDPLTPNRLVEDLDRGITMARASHLLEVVLRAVAENYDEYKDYNSTTTQSDYGDNLYILLDYLRLKAAYERHAWNLKPVAFVHEVLVRHRQYDVARLWRESFAQFNHDAADKFEQELSALEQQHRLRLRTVQDRIHERFVRSLDLDRLCALVAPTLVDDEMERRTAFDRWRLELRSFTDAPTGVGLDVPHWLERLEDELKRVRASQQPIAVLAQQWIQAPRRLLSYEELRVQLGDQKSDD